MALSLPGATPLSYIMLPLRLVAVVVPFCVVCPVLIVAASLRAVYLKCVRGKPSDILKCVISGNHPASHLPSQPIRRSVSIMPRIRLWSRYGTYPPEKGVNHKPDMHYPCQILLTKPLDAALLEKTLVKLCGEDGIEEESINVEVVEAEPADWPVGDEGQGSYPINYYIKDCNPPSINGCETDQFIAWGMFPPPEANKWKVKLRLWNGKPGKPTVLWYAGSGNGWDGSANFNFVKELLSRYIGNSPNNVYQRPELKAETIPKVDEGSFILFLFTIPFKTAGTLFMTLWNLVRAAKWAGGNGLGPRVVAMNFSKEESARLYAGAKAKGVSPFACFTYAGVKACGEVLQQQPKTICQQASLQTTHYPIPDASTRDLVGDWLFGPLQPVPTEYTLDDAQKAYGELKTEIRELGPATRKAFWAKAYGIFNCGAAGFECLPTYNDDMSILDSTEKCLLKSCVSKETLLPHDTLTSQP